MIVITGIGIVSSIGTGCHEVRQALLEEREGIAPVRHLRTIHKDYPAGEVDMSNEQMKAMLGIENKETSRTVLLGILALGEAIKHAGLTKHDIQTAALISGTTVADMDIVELQHKVGDTETGDCGETTRRMADYFGSWGATTTCSTACSSAANSILVGANLISSGRFERVVAGGSECLSRFHFNGFRTLMILDKEPCRPFDASRVGLNLGEGAAFLVMETLESARRRGVKPLAVLSGWGNACDAFHQTASSANGDGARLSMTKALSVAGLKPDAIDYVNAHGTGTPNNDASESEALRRVFGKCMPPVSSTKAMTGHTTSASGSIEAVICLLAIERRFIPPTLHWSVPMEDGLEPVSKLQTNRRLKHVLCNSFGFGGNDTSLVFSEFDNSGRQGEPSAARQVYLKTAVRYADIQADEMPKIPPMIARRLSAILKRALLTSLVLLQRTGVSSPDAIITATAKGCVADTLSFLDDISLNGEQLLKPTHFMQSTHNTIGSLIAIHTHSHGYNNTFSHGAESLASALVDARMQIEIGHAKNALVGLHDEQNEICTVMFLSDEGTVSELLNDKKIKTLCGDYCH